MSLNAAANRLHRSVRQPRMLRIQYTRRSFPDVDPFSQTALVQWVRDMLADNRIDLVDEVTIETGGRFSSYRFPSPETR
jgi:hypothetical protein